MATFSVPSDSITVFDFEGNKTLPSLENVQVPDQESQYEISSDAVLAPFELPSESKTPSESLPDAEDRIIDEFPISFKRKLLGANLDVVESLEKIDFSSNPAEDGAMNMNIAYLAMWKRGNISYKTAVEAPDTDASAEDKTTEDCQSIWGVSLLGEDQTKCPDPVDWEFSQEKLSPFDPSQVYTLDEYEFGDPEFRNPFTIRGTSFDLSENSSTQIFNALGTGEENKENRLTIIRQALLKGQKNYFRGGEIHRNNIEVITGRDIRKENIDKATRFSELTRSYDILRNDLVNDEQMRVIAFNLITDAYVISQGFLENKQIEENDETPGDFLDIKTELSKRLIEHRMVLKTRFIASINLDANNDLIDDVTSFRGQDTGAIALKNAEILDNAFAGPEERVYQDISNILDEILSIHEQYEEQKEEFGVSPIEVIPLPADREFNALEDVFIAEPNAQAERWRFPPPPGYQGHYTPSASLTKPDGIWQFLFNPENLKHDFGPRYTEAGVWANNEGAPLHWTGNVNETLSFQKTILNGYVFGRKVESLLTGIKELTRAMAPSSSSPPVLEFIWGKKYFGPCIMENISVTETMWDGGEVVNAEISFTLKKIPEWIVNDGYVNVFDPTGRPVVEIPDILQQAEAEEEVAVSSSDSSSDSPGGENNKSTAPVNTACRGALTEIKNIRPYIQRMIPNSSANRTTPIQKIQDWFGMGKNVLRAKGSAELVAEQRQMQEALRQAENLLKGSNNAIIKNILKDYDTNNIGRLLSLWSSSVTLEQQINAATQIVRELNRFDELIQSKLNGFSCPDRKSVSFIDINLNAQRETNRTSSSLEKCKKADKLISELDGINRTYADRSGDSQQLRKRISDRATRINNTYYTPLSDLLRGQSNRAQQLQSISNIEYGANVGVLNTMTAELHKLILRNAARRNDPAGQSNIYFRCNGQVANELQNDILNQMSRGRTFTSNLSNVYSNAHNNFNRICVPQYKKVINDLKKNLRCA